MKSKTAILATVLSALAEVPLRGLRRAHSRPEGRSGEASRDMIQAVLIAAIVLGVVVTIFAPQLQAFVASWFSTIRR